MKYTHGRFPYAAVRILLYRVEDLSDAWHKGHQYRKEAQP